MTTSKQVCQCCGKDINYDEEVVEIRLGLLRYTCNHDKTDWSNKKYGGEGRMFFHRACDVAIPSKEVE